MNQKLSAKCGVIIGSKQNRFILAKHIAMKPFVFIIVFFPVCLFGQIAPNNELIDFDQKLARRYLREHKVVSAYLNEVFNFGAIANVNDNTIWLKDVSANFTTLTNSKGFGLRVENEKSMYDWLKEHKSDRIYFFLNESRGRLELIGHSKNKHTSKVVKRLVDKEKIELADFDNVDFSKLNHTDYAVGRLEPNLENDLFPLFFSKTIILMYPTDLTMEPQTFLGYYPLVKRLSIKMVEAILQLKKKLVLKKLDNGYEIIGFTSRDFQEP